MISLRLIDASNYRECIELSVASDQQRFVASNLQSLADAYVWREEALEFYRRNEFTEKGEIHGGEIVMDRQL